MSSAADSLHLRLQVPERVASGARVPITFRVRNESGRSLDLYLTGREVTFDVIVERAGSGRVWRRLEGAVIPAVLRLETLAAGAELVLEDAWDQRTNRGEPVPPGEYRVHAELLVERGTLSSPAVPLVIAPQP